MYKTLSHANPIIISKCNSQHFVYLNKHYYKQNSELSALIQNNYPIIRTLIFPQAQIK